MKERYLYQIHEARAYAANYDEYSSMHETPLLSKHVAPPISSYANLSIGGVFTYG